MSDPISHEETSRIRVNDRPFRGRKFLVLASAALLACCWIVLASQDRRSYTCAVCRADRVDQSWLGVVWSREEGTDCSRWYESNVEPSHSHFWAAGGRCRRFGIPGIYGGYACSMGAPITGLSKTTQVEIYQHFENPVEAKQLFIHLGERNGNPYRTECALMEWVGQGYPGTWSDWWEKHRDVDQE